ncbi:RNA polymerase recycling motor ATPase HelR [Thalassiella azotivora]
MNPLSTSVFRLPEHLVAKADPTLVADDEEHLVAVAVALEAAVADLSHRLDAARSAPGGSGQQALDRDQEVHRLTARLRTLSRFGLDVCLGRMVPADGGRPVYVGRLGLKDTTGEPLLVDWRSPSAEPFFGATLEEPRGLASRRRYRWTDGAVTDYWDEVLSTDGPGHDPARLAPDDQSAFVAGLGASRSHRMRDVLGTIQADQDAIIRAGSRGALVVDGGPGTGKTVVALHRAAYLLHSEPRLGRSHGGILFVGPHQPYLSYVADVLPNLGEDAVRLCTLRDLVPGGADVPDEDDPHVARLKGDARMVDAVEPAVALYEEPPPRAVVVETAWTRVRLGPDDWAALFDAPDPGTPHNEAREVIWEELLALLVDAHADEDVPGQVVRAALERDADLRAVLDRSWPVLEPADVVGDLWSVPAYLRRCAPWLEPDEVRLLQRADPQAWTTSDLPLLDAARRRLGDPDVSRRRRRRRVALAAEQARVDEVVEHLVATDDSEMQVMSMLRGQDLQYVLVDEAVGEGDARDPLAGPFAHVVVDEAQELTDAEWRVLLARCPSRSLTVVGDRAQARRGFDGTWQERLERVGAGAARVMSLRVGYRTPREVMQVAEPVIRAAVPDANVPASVREAGVPVRYGARSDLEPVVDAWLAEHHDGVACVVGAPWFAERPRVRSLAPVLAKGLEFDLVVLVDPDRWDAGTQGAVDRYVAMTRTTRQLVVLTADGRRDAT